MLNHSLTLKPRADGFRNYSEKIFAVSPEEMMLDKAQLLQLTPAEMTVLVGGMRSLASVQQAQVWGDGTKLDNGWFKTLLDMSVSWTRQAPTATKQKTAFLVRLCAMPAVSTLCSVAIQNCVHWQRFMHKMIITTNLSLTLSQHGQKVMDLDRFDLKN